jgi:hypothetical protein
VRLFGKAASPSIPSAAGVRLGMSASEAKRLAPELFAASPLHPEGLADVGVHARDDGDGHVSAIVVVLPRASALAELVGIWGEPVKGYDKHARSDLYWWFDPAAHLRARLEDDPRDAASSRLLLEAYLPLPELMAEGRERFGVERALGAGNAELCRSQILLLAPVEQDAVAGRVRVECGGGRVRSYQIMVRYAEYFALKDEILRALRKKLGEPSAAKDIMGREVLAYPETATMRVRFRDEPTVKDAIIEVTRTAPASP